MQVQFGKKEYGFFPQTFVLPFDLKQLKRAWEDGGNKQKWIIKPVSEETRRKRGGASGARGGWVGEMFVPMALFVTNYGE